MTKAILGFFHSVNSVRVLPHLALMLVSPNRAIIEDDLAAVGEAPA